MHLQAVLRTLDKTSSMWKHKFFSVKVFGLQSVYGEKGNSDFRVGVEVVKRMQIFCFSSLGSLMRRVMLECF